MTGVFRMFYIVFIGIIIGDAAIAIASDSTKLKLGVLPSAFYTKETRLGFGGIFCSYFDAGKHSDNNKRSSTQSYLFYTLNKQFSFENDYRLWLRNNKYYLTGSVDFCRFPEFFYGITNSSIEADRVMIAFDMVRVQAKNLRQIKGNLYGGIYYQFQFLYNQDVSLTRKVAAMHELIPGGMGYCASGVGPILIYDKRDNPLNPAKGAYMETSLQFFDKLIGSEHKFTSYILDLRKYNTLFKSLIWNSNFYVHLNSGEVPYRMLAAIGGPRFLRGYYRGRFRDNNMFVLQQEVRLPVFGPIGVATFAGIGSVAHSLSAFSMNEMHYNYGLGLRIKVNKKENTNLRIDYGITKDSRGIYVVFAEAF